MVVEEPVPDLLLGRLLAGGAVDEAELRPRPQVLGVLLDQVFERLLRVGEAPGRAVDLGDEDLRVVRGGLVLCLDRDVGGGTRAVEIAGLEEHAPEAHLRARGVLSLDRAVGGGGVGVVTVQKLVVAGPYVGARRRDAEPNEPNDKDDRNPSSLGHGEKRGMTRPKCQSTPMC